MAAALRRVVVLLGLASGVQADGMPVTHVVVIEGVKYTPDTLQVRPGDWVQWINKDPFPHTVTARAAFDSRSIAAGGTWKYRVRRSGLIAYTCALHPNMTGIIRVEPTAPRP